MLFDWLFKRKRKKRDYEEELEQDDRTPAEARKEESAEVDEILSKKVSFEKENVDLKNAPERLSYLGRLRDTILEGKKQCDDVKFEYGRVTSYLKDIQLIDNCDEDYRQIITEAATNIVELNEQRNQIKKKKFRISESQRVALDRFEEETPKDIEKLLEAEDYQVKIRNDLRRLSGEKHLLEDEKADIAKRQSTLKSISKALVIVLLIVGIGLGVLVGVYRVDITVPFIATAAFVFLIAAIILAEARRNRMDMAITERKQNKAVALTNQVKIRYVNNVRTMDYLCAKYKVRGATELDFVFSQYKEAKREWARQREGTIQLEENHEILLNALAKIAVRDREIWLSQAKALIDPSEMVEVRHELNVKRQKLREQLDYNTSVMTECLNEMEKIQSKKPEYARDVERILAETKGLR
ncbi:MAG: hypothetical protein K5639_00380 [Eubacterium sp.]|nr:hypothetical protein [Eubacterium sp.]